MNDHLEKEIELITETDSSLYDWSLVEKDPSGKEAERHLIPWKYTLFYTAKEITLNTDSTLYASNPDNEPTTEDSFKESIMVKLEPGVVSEDGRWEHVTNLSMFGTDRHIDEIKLFIEREGSLSSERKNYAYGIVSYTSEIDFRNVTEPDVIEFIAIVKAEEFDDLKSKIESNRIDKMTVLIGSVNGFYSEWSPSISTWKVKVLTNGSQQVVKTPENCKITPPRLDKVGELTIRTKCSNPLQTCEEEEEQDGEEELRREKEEERDRKLVDFQESLILLASSLNEKTLRLHYTMWLTMWLVLAILATILATIGIVVFLS